MRSTIITLQEAIRLRVVSFFIAMEAWFIKILFSQLFLTTFSLPLLLWWGLPISTLTIVGNIVFNPCIGLFLLLCTLLFFCELLSIPSSPIVWALEQVTDAWLWVVAQGSRHALIAVPRPSAIVMIAIVVVAVWIMYRFAHRQRSGIIAFALFLSAIYCGSRLMLPSYKTVAVPYGSKSLFLMGDYKRCFLFDTLGVLRSNQSRSWADFTLRPELVAQFGRVSCDALVIMQPTVARMRVADELAQRLHIPYLFIPEESLGLVRCVVAHIQTQIVPIKQALLEACYHQNNGVVKEHSCAEAVKKVWYSSKHVRICKNKGLSCLKK
jgi:hypothetical protein